MLEIDLPQAFVLQMEGLLGQEATSLFRALETKPPLRGLRLHRWTTDPLPATDPLRATDPVQTADGSTSLRVNPYAIATPTSLPPNVTQRLGKPVPWMQDAFYIPTDSPLGKTIYHEAGAFYIQEPSAMAVACALDVKPGERVLDLCAAPGGKTTALARALQGQGVLVANEIHPKRVVTLAQNLERLGIPAIVVNESVQRLATAWPGGFDAVLVDAPCSGEGMFRKDTTARQEWTGDSPTTCAARQREILEAAVKLVRPGGRLVYSTCTLNPVENEQVVDDALRHLPVSLLTLPDWEGWSQGRPEWAHDNPAMAATRRLWPHIGEGEGHFVALFRVHEQSHPTQAPVDSRERRPRHEQRDDGDKRKHRHGAVNPGEDTRRWLELADELLTSVPGEWRQVTRHKDLVFAAPPEDLSTAGLKVLRPGLCLAEIQGRRIQPHHSLAMAVHRDLVRQKVSLEPEEAAQYMAGLSPENYATSGWNLMQTSSGLPVGWGKGVPGRVNNAYPKGLRRQGLLV